ncbi:methyltransferase domain-containing protein [Synechocystis sp. LKSZ1]|uniref:methyltransferase domain-containing protein n=1 Tax=Synechocystis sp. LKSZ1 TaxID=3144951 RepID=UPI00336C092D
MVFPSFQIRTDTDELMDDFSITDERLTEALEQLRWVNRLLGGYSTTMAILAPFLQSRAGQVTRILDLGTGIADFPEYIVRWAEAQSVDIPIEITAVDANPATIDYAQQTLEKRLNDRQRAKISLEVADALALPYADHAFDIGMGAMFLHHFAQPKAIAIVKDLQRVSQHGIIINDLHRHPLAYAGIYSLTRLLPAAPMVRHDGPLSVLRGFRANDLTTIAEGAGLTDFSLRWYFPFRWLLSTVRRERSK